MLTAVTNIAHLSHPRHLRPPPHTQQGNRARQTHRHRHPCRGSARWPRFGGGSCRPPLVPCVLATETHAHPGGPLPGQSTCRSASRYHHKQRKGEGREERRHEAEQGGGWRTKNTYQGHGKQTTSPPPTATFRVQIKALAVLRKLGLGSCRVVGPAKLCATQWRQRQKQAVRCAQEFPLGRVERTPPPPWAAPMVSMTKDARPHNTYRQCAAPTATFPSTTR